MDIPQILIEALNKRNIFHSEADFQHHLAWEIHHHIQEDLDIRLEFPLSKDGANKWEYCDIFARKPIPIGIELKYKTKKLKRRSWTPTNFDESSLLFYLLVMLFYMLRGSCYYAVSPISSIVIRYTLLSLYFALCSPCLFVR